MSGLKKRIMIVDDDENFSYFLRQELEERGYEIVTAKTEAEAAEEIRHGSAQFFIFDLFLENVEDEYEKTSPYRLLKLLGEHYNKNAWIGWSNVNDRNGAFRYWVSEYSDQIRQKALGDAETYEWIDQRFARVLNWDFVFVYFPGDEKLVLQCGAVLEGERLKTAVEELARMLIDRPSPIFRLTAKALPDQGHGNALKLQLTPSVKRGRPNWYVLKAGQKVDIEKEYSSYRDFVRHYAFRHPVSAIGSKALRRNSMGGLLYHFVRHASQLREYYDVNPSESVGRVIANLFDEIIGVWSDPHVESNDLRAMTFNDERAERDVEFLSNMMAGLLDDDCDYGAEKLELKYGSESIVLFNPNPFLGFLANPLALWIEGLAHGDLHSGNVLVLEGTEEPVLIDFSETGENHAIFRDFAKFEAHAALELLAEPPDLVAVKKFIAWQIDPNSFVPSDWSGRSDDWPEEKALGVIRQVRQWLREHIRENLPGRYRKLSDNELFLGYHFALWREYVRTWSWMAESSPLRRLQNLATASRIVELYCMLKQGEGDSHAHGSRISQGSPDRGPHP